MSTAVESEMMFCASCGTAGSDDIKLKNCTACYLVRYCGVKCQKEHRPKHKRECKKRAAELKDEILFKQPESTHLGDCSICCLPLPLDPEKYCLNSCCSKIICQGCNCANIQREHVGRLQHICPFCRKSMPNDEEINRRLMKRIEANDPVAMCHFGTERCKIRDYEAAFEYWTKAVSLGDVEAHYRLSLLYHNGDGIEKDKKKEFHHLTEAAIKGHPLARHNIGCFEAVHNDRHDRAAKHWIIAANLGHDDSLVSLKKAYKAGFASKEDFTTALRGHKAAIDATKSPQREEAAKLMMQAADRERRGV